MKQEIENYLTFSETELLFKIANEGSVGAIDFDPIERGRMIFNNFKERYRHEICKNEIIRKYFKDGDKNDKVNLVAALLDMFTSIKMPISPFTVCVLLVKEGLDTFCKIEWDDK